MPEEGRWTKIIAAATILGVVVAIISVFVAINPSYHLDHTPTPTRTPQVPFPTETQTSQPPPSEPTYLEDLSPSGDAPELGVASIQGHVFRHSIEYKLGIISGRKKTSAYSIKGAYQHFRAYLGTDPRGNPYANPASFDIYVDDKRVSAGDPIGNAGPCALDIPVTNARTLTLDIAYGGDGLGGNYAALGDARLVNSLDVSGEPKLPACAQNP